MTALTFHELANLFPLLEGQAYLELVEDIRANGLIEPIVLFEGAILDGRNRYRACNAAQVSARFETYTGSDPLGLVISLNLKRRHLSTSQRAMVAANMANISHGGQRANLPLDSVGNTAAADMLNVSERSVKTARSVRDSGEQEYIDKVTSGELTISAAAKEINAKKAVARREERLDNIVEISKGNTDLNTDQKYPIIYADPPWRYENPPMGGTNRSIENHYPTMTLEEICALPVGDLASQDAMLYMWATAPKLSECLEVIEAWGFEYRTNLVWDKERIGMGYHARNQHELLLVAKRGSIPPPQAGKQPSSVHREKRTKHSSKPHFYYEMIEAAYPQLPKIELFCRAPRQGWSVWGNQSKGEAA